MKKVLSNIYPNATALFITRLLGGTFYLDLN